MPRSDTEPTASRPDLVTERLALTGLDYPIPAAANRFRHMLGGLTAFFLTILVLTGVYLAQFYDPSPEGAYDSVRFIIVRAPLGDWIRSLHYWSAGAAVLTITAHLAVTFWRRVYRRPREITWWAGVAMAGLLFLFLVTGTALRNDQEGSEALAHFVAGGNLTGLLGRFFTPEFTASTPLLSRIFSLHTSALPLALVALMGLHFWLIRHLGISVRSDGSSVFRTHLRRLTGVALLTFAVVGFAAVLFPEGLGYPAVAGAEITKPFWPVLWIYGLENLLGAWGMILGPTLLFGFLALTPLFDRSEADRRGWVSWTGLLLGLVVVGFWLYGVFGEAQQHIGM